MYAKAFLAAATLLLTSAFAQTPHYDTMKIGTSAPDFNLPNVDGRNYSLKDFADAKLLAVVFTCTHCPRMCMPARHTVCAPGALGSSLFNRWSP